MLVVIRLVNIYIYRNQIKHKLTPADIEFLVSVMNIILMGRIYFETSCKIVNIYIYIYIYN